MASGDRTLGARWWIEKNELGALAAGMRRAFPHMSFSDADLRCDDDRPELDERWFRSTASVGDQLLVKYAWSAPAADRIAREGCVMATLAAFDPQLRLPEVVAWSVDPAMFITRRVAGEWLWYPEASQLDGARLDRVVTDLGLFLARLHAPAALEAVLVQGIELHAPEPQATTDALRSSLGQFVGKPRQALVEGWCNWVDAVLDQPAPTVLLHGDFAGHNLLWDQRTGAVNVFYDLEEVSAGDPAYDFRYLPSQAETPAILHGTIAAYNAAGGGQIDLRRVFAWHVRTALGDALWRSQAGVSLPFDGTAADWVDELADRLTASDIDTSQPAREG